MKDHIADTVEQILAPSFELGSIFSTPGAIESLLCQGNGGAQRLIAVMISRHAHKDWGDLGDEDKKSNDDATFNGGRILSAYTIEGVKYWIITDGEDEFGIRRTTTILLPDEY